jgi:hypothetical protein
VYSDNPDTCRHVFHEDCMVRYLANHSERTKVSGGTGSGNLNNNRYNRRYAHNPCPTCRQPFCQVSNEDLIIAVLLKSVEVALQEEPREITSTTHISDSDIDSNIDSDSNSERIVAAASLAMESAAIVGSGLSTLSPYQHQYLYHQHQ